ncbi:MAG: hypothetical protein H6832_02830 [Planctomycetes bacterium]|nr:hypothetical protein [Planctomycetota bacterium]MCB9917316.1 hypothetical protein [Planctomycetota bacterium]
MDLNAITQTTQTLQLARELTAGKDANTLGALPATSEQGQDLFQDLLPQVLEVMDLAGLFGTGTKGLVDGSKLEWAKALEEAIPAGQKNIVLDQVAQLGGISKGLGFANAGMSLFGILGAEDKSDALFEAAGGAVGAKVGQSVGSSIGAGAMMAFGVTAPLAPVGAVVGGAIGSMVGEELGEMAGGELGDFAEDVMPEMEAGLDKAGDAVSDAWDSVSSIF